MRLNDEPYEDQFGAHLRARHDWTEAKLDAVDGSFERAHASAHNDDAGHDPGELEVPHGVCYRPPPPEIRKAFGSFAEMRDQRDP